MRSMRSRSQHSQRGVALMVAMVTMTSLLWLGATALMSVQGEVRSMAQGRFSRAALYAAESGTSAGMDFLRSNCSTSQLFTQWISASNSNPQSPTTIIGNKAEPGADANPFPESAGQWFEVTILNNPSDPGFASGADTDGIVIVRSVGHGPDDTRTVVDLTVQNTTCLASFCEHEYAQRNVTSRNDANAACSARVTSSALRTFTP